MARFHTTDKGNVPFTPQEEAEWDAKAIAATIEKINEAAAQAASAAAELDKADLLAHLATMEADATLPARVRAFAGKLKKVL